MNESDPALYWTTQAMLWGLPWFMGWLLMARVKDLIRDEKYWRERAWRAETIVRAHRELCEELNVEESFGFGEGKP